NLFAQNSYRFAKGWSAEVSGFYSSPSIWQGTLKSASIWSADAGLQRQILNGNGTIKASVSDVFRTLNWSAYSHFAGQDVDVAGRHESRQFKLNFSYRFGNRRRFGSCFGDCIFLYCRNQFSDAFYRNWICSIFIVEQSFRNKKYDILCYCGDFWCLVTFSPFRRPCNNSIGFGCIYNTCRF
ncbi:MAG: hypothetical protein EOO07_32935, partial [Chitinophagaceae bacterium]